MLENYGRKLATALSAVLAAAVYAASPASAELNTPPRVDPSASNPQPVYPDWAQANGEMGTVLVDVLVRPSGKPARIKLSRTSGYEDLDTAAIEGVSNWHYVPATRDGEPVSDWMTVKIVFQPPAFVSPPAPVPAGAH